jgi:hypothetical protein
MTIGPRWLSLTLVLPFDISSSVVVEEEIAGSARGCLLDVDVVEVVEAASLPVSDWELEYEVLLIVKGRCGADRIGRMNGRRSLEWESVRKDFMRARKKLLRLRCVCKQSIYYM